jgi:hypothetical protein
MRQHLTRFLHSVVLHPRRGPYFSVVLLLLTSASIYWTGGPDGTPLLAGVLAIILAHEGGHYAACRIHGVASTWPLLLPAPILNPITGTLGARSPTAARSSTSVSPDPSREWRCVCPCSGSGCATSRFFHRQVRPT